MCIRDRPVHRDCIINAKFVAALIVIGIMLFVLGFLVMAVSYTHLICSVNMEGGEHGRASDCIDRLDQAVWALHCRCV